ncbi:unnamed protein product [Arctia plantaginis]|uniref:Uncharacterized protein n=1 Tax=Arctia plantaginis TaxID=874455 RepID=A0A8S1B5X7_ARCPL|nr:unnamed protein product [Arctia plantaginis]
MKCVLILVLAVLAIAMASPQQGVNLVKEPDSFWGQPSSNYPSQPGSGPNGPSVNLVPQPDSFWGQPSSNYPGGAQPSPYQPGSGPNRPSQGIPQSWLRSGRK